MKYNKNVYKSLTLVTQFGINMLVPIFLCTFAGIYIDKWFSTNYWCVLLFFVGALAGYRNIYVFAKKIYEEKSDLRNERRNRKR